MALTLTDATTATAISSSDYNANNTAIENAVNSLDGANLQSSSVANAALANTACYSALQVTLDNTRQTAYLLMPGTGTWNIDYVGGILTDNGTTDTTVTVKKGSVATSVFTPAATIDTLTFTGSTDGYFATDNNSVTATIDGGDVLEVTISSLGTSALTADSDNLTVTLQMYRAIGG